MNIPLILSTVVLSSLLVLSFSSNSPTVPAKSTHLQYVADFSDDKVLMGASHNVFVGRVVKQSGNKELGIGPETQFEVEIIENIKGELKGTVVVNQQGGYKNNVLYIVESDDILPSKAEDYLLRPGSTYLLATRYNEAEGWYTLNPYPTASKLLSSDTGATTESLLSIAKEDDRIGELKVAYSKETLLEADLRNNKTYNKYEEVEVNTEKIEKLDQSVLQATTTPDTEQSEESIPNSQEESAVEGEAKE